jgi:hypothetical protein
MFMSDPSNNTWLRQIDSGSGLTYTVYVVIMLRAYTSLGKFVSRADMGLPRDWSRIQDWLNLTVL